MRHPDIALCQARAIYHAAPRDQHLRSVTVHRTPLPSEQFFQFIQRIERLNRRHGVHLQRTKALGYGIAG